MKQEILKFVRSEDGLTTVEYAIAGGLVGAAVILSFVDLGNAVDAVIRFIVDSMNTNTPAA